MDFIVRRKDPPPWVGGPEQKWQTVARRKTLREARRAMVSLKSFCKIEGTAWWCGEETRDNEADGA